MENCLNSHRKHFKFLTSVNRSSPRDLTTENASKCLQKWCTRQPNFKSFRLENRAISGVENRIFTCPDRYFHDAESADAGESGVDMTVIQHQISTKVCRHFTPKTVQRNDKFQTPKTRHFWTLKMARKPLRIPYEMPPQNGLKKHTENRHFLDPQNNTFWK